MLLVVFVVFVVPCLSDFPELIAYSLYFYLYFFMCVAAEVSG